MDPSLANLARAVAVKETVAEPKRAQEVK